MNKTQSIQIIEATLLDKGFKYIGPGPSDYSGVLDVNGKQIDVKLSISDVRFAEKPRVSLTDRSQIPLETLAHIDSGDGGICYVSGAGLPLDMYQPGEAILRVLEEVTRTLGLSYKGRAQQEFIDEYQLYWRAKYGASVFLPRSSATGVVETSAFFAKKDGKAEFIAIRSSKNLSGYTLSFFAEAQIWSLSENIGPSVKIKVPLYYSELNDWLSSQKLAAEMSWSKAENLLLNEGLLILAAPNAVVGLQLEVPAHLKSAVDRKRIRKRKLADLLRKNQKNLKLLRYSCSWCSLEDIASRNCLGSQNLKETSVALVGCGTIGGHLAKMLIQSGVGSSGKLSLFDRDRLAEGNIGRHLLGFGDIGKNKALAVKAELERFHPDVQVFAHTGDAMTMWGQLKQHDIIIDATGEWNVQTAINDSFLNEDRGNVKALIHSWVFMNGAAVQSFLNLGDDYACFRCLKPDFAGQWRYPAGNEDEPLNLMPASCGDGAYVPFSVDVSTMAASLANKAVLDWATGNPGPRLRTVVIDFQRGRTQKPVSPTPSKLCPACSHSRGSP
ncbi:MULTISPECIES: ThiF family adenylyltransferase [Thalassospira]|uniref:Thiamine biosynthesis protein ThiF n=1 Tax=Thalassospira profundimaris TaxID=502049 RepID=A0A367VK01_9PROT|nr:MULTISPECIES: ThiF family adenylyltransferase [Thalassospira]KZB70806.1 thiamine biosynthesis protein ThiF [Thalassospira sp. MCCC 1A01148]RCK25558.1 thiamine biosynthesis protein ThiF [Thalassospira profundimaris]